ncbi:MAG: sigma-70 family RNA polymerase sigma factor [Deltaproteobacteria bacterium]|nr:sigma-70 family RNA polymerase sigma factor [Deltaproteobacteria bacterium]
MDEDATLVARAKEGDFAAFEELVTRSEGRVYQQILRLVGNVEDARELLQETYLSAYRNLPSFKGDSAFSTWVYRIGTNHALMRLRRKHPEEVGLEEIRLPTHEELKARRISDWELDPKEAVLRKELREELDKAIQSLPAGYRAVVVLRDIDELDTAETAKELGITEGAVKTRLHRARIFLREALAHYFEPQEHERSSGGAR